MPVNTNLRTQEKQKDSSGKLESMADTSRKSVRKAPGTRIGTLVDWREASRDNSGRYGYVVRDGR